MKKTILYSALAVITFLTTSAIQYNSNECDVRALKNETLKNLKPDYKYDSSKITRFLFTNKEQVIEIAAPLFKDDKYRFIFNVAGMPIYIGVKFYDKKKGSKKRKELYSLQKVEGQNIYFFDPIVSKKIYLDYIVPRTTKQKLTGCIVCVIGYHLNKEE